MKVVEGQLPRPKVKVPGELVDFIVVAPPEQHWQTYAVQYSPAFCGEATVPADNVPPMDMSSRKIIGRRAILELDPHSVV